MLLSVTDKSILDHLNGGQEHWLRLGGVSIHSDAKTGLLADVYSFWMIGNPDTVEKMAKPTDTPLVIYGGAHFYRTRDYGDDIGIARTLEIDYPGRTLVVIP